MTGDAKTRALIDKAIAARDATIPKAYLLPKSAYPLPKNVTGLLKSSGIMSAKELEIVELSGKALAEAIAAGKYTAVEATTAYCKSAALAQQGTNCLIEEFADEALARAKELDEYMAKNGGPMGPLHGVPVSIKDHINVKGHDTPASFLGLVGSIAKEDAHLVRILRDAGAVFYCKTTNPQTIMHLETSGYLGVTVNPYNTDLTAGGSSGGEGALVAMKGSPIGVGTDVGGSVRSPAAACGIYTIKPSCGRIPYGGVVASNIPAGVEGILSTQGPMTRSVDDLDLYMKIMCDAKPWLEDPSVWNRPWLPVKDTGKKLRIGVLKQDGVVRPVAPTRRALEYVLDKLGASGQFEVVEYEHYKVDEAWGILSQLYWPDGGKKVKEQLLKTGEPMMHLTEWVIGESTGEKTLPEWLAYTARRDQFRLALAKHWRDAGVDVVLSPVYPTPAPQHNTSKYWLYTAYWNLANYPACVFPTGLFVDPKLDKEDGSYKPRNEKEKYVYDNYDAEKQAGAPLSLQLITYHGHEEEVIHALRKVVACLGKK